MKKIEITLTTSIEIMVDDANYIVQEYENEDSLLEHLVSYDFNSVLPVIHEGGVKILNKEITEYEITDREEID